MISNIGGIAFESFGNYLKRAGQDDVTRSVGANGGLFYWAFARRKAILARIRTRKR